MIGCRFYIIYMEEVEVWKDIPGWEGYYKISSFGKIKSLSRIKKVGYNSFKTNDRIMSPGVSSSGYKHIGLSKDGNTRSFTIHKLMAITFLNHIPCGHKLVIDHKDGDKFNNHIENIQIVSSRDNASVCFRKNRDTLSSRYTGVILEKDRTKWRSRITINGKCIHLGFFISEEAAAQAYIDALCKIPK